MVARNHLSLHFHKKPHDVQLESTVFGSSSPLPARPGLPPAWPEEGVILPGLFPGGGPRWSAEGAVRPRDRRPIRVP